MPGGAGPTATSDGLVVAHRLVAEREVVHAALPISVPRKLIQRMTIHRRRA
jgi:hypothetical protein